MSKKANGDVAQYIRGYVEPDVERAARHFPGWSQRHKRRLERLLAANPVELTPEQRDIYESALETASIAAAVEHLGKPWGGWTLALDTETTTDTRQALRFGFYELHGMRRDEQTQRAMDGTLTREGLDQLYQAGVYYNPDELNPADVLTIRAYASARGLRCMTRARFVDFLYTWVRRYGALLIGHNVPFDLSRLAARWTRGGTGYRNGFRFALCSCEHRLRDGTRSRQCFQHPALNIKVIGHLKAFIGFQLGRYAPNAAEGAEESSRYADDEKLRGRFLDTATLARALLGPGDMSLKGLAQMLATAHQKLDTDEHGATLSPVYLDYARQDVTVTWELYQALRDLYGRHGLDTPLWKIYSEASIGKAYLSQMGITPLRERHPDFPKDVLGYGMAALYGARVECAVRLQPIEVEYLDFLSQYSTVNALLGLQDLLLAKTITVRRGSKVVDDVRALLDRISLDDLQHPEVWRQLRVLCLVKPDHDRLPFRTEYGPAGRNVALPRIEHGLETWYALPDLIASKLLTGKAPHVLDAVELVPSAENIETKPLAFFGDAAHTIDPQTMDIFSEVVSLRCEIKEQRDAAKKRGNTAEAARLDAVQLGLKLMASGTSYGIFIEENEEDEYQDARPVTVHAVSTWQTKTKHVEVAGKYAFPPIGCLIAAGGRLLLALAERCAADQGIGYAMMDTDGLALVKPGTMSRAEFYRRAAEVRAWFTPLSPHRGQPPILEQEEQNRWDGQREPLFFPGIADKRYALYNLVPDPDGPIEQGGERYNVRIRKFSSHGLGVFGGRTKGYQSPAHIPEPHTLGPDGKPSSAKLGGARWCYDIWYEAVVALESGRYPNGVPVPRHDGAPHYTVPGGTPGTTAASFRPNPWLMQPASYQVTVSTWHLLKQYSADYDGHLDDLRPFSFFTLLPGFTKEQRTLRQCAALAKGDERLAQVYSDLPSGQPFIGPYCASPEALRKEQVAGHFAWYDTALRCWRTLPSDVETPTLAECIHEYYQRPAYKSSTPRAMGTLSIPVIDHVDKVAVINKETNSVALLTAEQTDAALMACEAGMDGAQVYGVELGGPAGLVARMCKERISDMRLASGVPPRTLRDLKSGKTTHPTSETSAALTQGLWLLDAANPDGIAGWRDIPSGELAELLGAGWTREDVQGVRSGTRSLTQDERERFITAIHTWQCEQTSEDDTAEAAERDARRFVEHLRTTAESAEGAV
jgi:hypothetical protein